MATSISPGVVLLLAALQLSVCTWLWLAWKQYRGDVVFPAVQREPLSWDARFVGMAIIGAFVSPAIGISLMQLGKVASVRHVQATCLMNLVQAAWLMCAFWPSGIREKMGLRLSWTDVRLAALMFLLSLAPVYGLNILITLSGWRAEQGIHDYFLLIEADPTPRTLLWIAFSVSIAAPLVEELLFRVVIQGWLESFLPGDFALLVVAAIFAGIHYRTGRPDHIPLFALALALGYLYHRRRSFFAVALVHSLFNTLNLTMALLGME